MIPSTSTLRAIAALWRLGRSSHSRAIRWSTPFVLLATLGVIAYLNIDTYFGRQANHPEVYAAFSTDETLIARDMVRQRNRGYSLMTSRQFLFSMPVGLLAGGPKYDALRAPDMVPIDASHVARGVAVYLEPNEASVHRLLKAYYPGGYFEDVRTPGGERVLFHLAVLTRDDLAAPRGLLARRTSSEGVVHESVLRSAEVAWGLKEDAGQAPFEFDWEGSLHITEPGPYLLRLEGPSSAEVLFDGERLLWSDRKAARIEPAVGLHYLTVKNRGAGNSGAVRLWWQPPGGDLAPIPYERMYHHPVRPVGLAGRFYRGSGEKDRPDAVHVTHAMDVVYYHAVLPYPYLAVWEGTLEAPASGRYAFRVGGFGAVTLTVDEELTARSPSGPAVGPYGIADLDAGEHKIRVEYRAPFAPSEVEVLWAPPGKPLGPIPIERLSPAREHMFRVVPSDE